MSLPVACKGGTWRASWRPVGLEGALNQAWLPLLEGWPQRARDILSQAPTDSVSVDDFSQRHQPRAWALVEILPPGAAVAAVSSSADPDGNTSDPGARRDLSRHPLRALRGQLLLGWDGEDPDPQGFGERRTVLAEMAPCLRGPQGAHARRARGAVRRAVALARLVCEAFGAHRLLIMLRRSGGGNR
ncbi:MAG: hypothetical protein GXP62_01855 [Oligoflexia bacterium]|nr:hypothetical protein [Oligoflexia bacterium]